MTTETSSSPKPRRRWLQYSLRTLMLVMLLCALAAAWVGAEYRKGLRQKAAIAWVENMGGSIEYDDEATQNDWRRQWFGEWFPKRVKRITLILEWSDRNDTLATDLTPLTELENLRELHIEGTPVTNLAPLAKLENLELLILPDMIVTDLTPLAELENFEELYLHGVLLGTTLSSSEKEQQRVLAMRAAGVTDLAPLAGLPKLRVLHVSSREPMVTLQQAHDMQQVLPNFRLHARH